MIPASSSPGIAFSAHFLRLHNTHKNENGRNDRQVGLVSAVTPQSAPKPTNANTPRFSISSVSQKIMLSRNAVRLVSHTHRTDQYITYGSTAHVHADHSATFSSKHFFAM